jgi:hypothetical protein
MFVVGIFIILFCLALAMYNSYLIEDSRIEDGTVQDRKSKRAWHCWGAVIFILLAGLGWYVGGWQWTLLTLSVFWLIFAGIVHAIALKKSFFYVGTTAVTDRMIRSMASFLNMKPVVLAAILKISAVVISVIFIILSAKSESRWQI